MDMPQGMMAQTMSMAGGMQAPMAQPMGFPMQQMGMMPSPYPMMPMMQRPPMMMGRGYGMFAQTDAIVDDDL